MNTAVTYFSENYNQDINIEDYAASRGMSVSWFIRNFKKYTGSTPMQFIVGIRINNAQMLLETTTYSINEISKIVGQQPIPSMKSLKSSDMITSCISVGFFTS